MTHSDLKITILAVPAYVNTYCINDIFSLTYKAKLLTFLFYSLSARPGDPSAHSSNRHASSPGGAPHPPAAN